MSIPATKSGYGFIRGQKTIQKLTNLPVKLPQGSEILLRVHAAGMCQSDLHLLHAQETHIPDSFVMGHEIAGEIAAVGPNVNTKKFPLGLRVAAQICNACGDCEFCRQGLDSCCTGNDGQAFGLSCDGGYLPFLLITNPRCLLPIPDNVSYEIAAITSDAMLTPFHAVKKAGVCPGNKVLMFGLGGLGSSALQILKNYGCQVVVVEQKESARALANKLGADGFFTSALSPEFNAAYKPNSFDVCFDVCGVQETFEACVTYVKYKGTIVPIGLGRSKLFFRALTFASKEARILGTFGGSSAEQLECMEWVSKGMVTPIVGAVYDLDELPNQLEKMAKGEISGRVVFRPQSVLRDAKL
ncbi:hypothetical protein BABINDRAFT_6142 [Babjeviella inositovora NRRL Y-12698]|uniref:Enoyl reductase (ER) domain-containing protein n=1 Tax=Babjeviella inositovora NRRL Y-12698 TaxID=984486 RepID=A0A1E3QUV8_9ASCO|nr:uncharacterized protein BABINDRAFT_6142 [Babjeviella inositovora NRRL Y-12698]ODQ81440.1 hypothetical protein BABINDRAFT_6142 [Babjeviella inositovora NRRL Y-12698]